MAVRTTRPTYPLAKVAALARDCAIGTKVAKRTAEDYSEDLSLVDAFIKKVIAALKPADFCYSERQEYPDGKGPRNNKSIDFGWSLV